MDISCVKRSLCSFIPSSQPLSHLSLFPGNIIYWFCHWSRHLWNWRRCFSSLLQLHPSQELSETRDVPKTVTSGDAPCWPSLSSWRRKSVLCLVFLQLEQSYADLAQISHKKLSSREERLKLESFIPKGEFIVKLWVTEMWRAGAVKVGWGGGGFTTPALRFLPWTLGSSPMHHPSPGPLAKSTVTLFTHWKRIRTVTSKATSRGKRSPWIKFSLYWPLKMTVPFFPTSQTLSPDAHKWILLKSERPPMCLTSVLGDKKVEL